ncbi:Argininosuccinate lyase [Rhodovastum atsumiense]|uniref:Argininosuccinate lyase n=1 Tax=Rhodovastum atsumiense TaxID=504468 RepID=A0A5M6ISI3_9PROT|nr:argininosuccinate lyase [Rhodovastum atsumiense]KAA5610435.1 argininosuccinate lyase [Rhodovastum atsumiense]CAH2600417.1 Argininosuccinate lyase [Rhodovastum atsumiense]
MHITAMSAIVLASLAGVAHAEGAKQDFTLINKTGYELSEVYVSPSKSNDWQEDVLGRDTLGDGERTNIHFSRNTSTCRWDLKVVYTVDSSSAVWSNIDLCSVSKITIRYDKNNDVTRASFE